MGRTRGIRQREPWYDVRVRWFSPSWLRGLSKDTQFWYALLLVGLIPALLIGNSWLLLRAVHRDVNFVLRRESALVQNALEPFLPVLLQDLETLRERLEHVIRNAPEIVSATVVIPEASGTFALLASTVRDPTPDLASPLNALVLATGESHAVLVRDPGSGVNAWSVVAPVREGTRIVALTNFKISVEDVAVILQRTTRDSLLLLAATVVVVLLLLLNHFRFFASARLLRKLQEVDRMKDEFIALASHELRTPLTTIRGYAELLREAVEEQSAGAVGLKEAEVVLRETHHLNELVDDLLDVSRIQQGRMLFEMQEVALPDVVRAVVEVLTPKAQEKGLTLRYESPDTPLVVSADPQRLRQVFVNLVENAVKYTLKGSVTVRHEVRGKHVATMVSDTGVGMTPEERERLFEKFYRIRDEETRTIRGTGLGLWITQQMVERLGGKIYVDSVKGQGSQFTVLLPLLRAEAT